jgi:hypothetical protein
MLSTKAATAESGHALYNALQQFHPELDEDGTGDYYVSVGLGNDRQVIEVLNAIQAFLAHGAVGAVESMSVSLDGRSYRIHGEAQKGEG